jgi:hypothetical protein
VKSGNECGPENASAHVLVERPNSASCFSRSQNAHSDQDNRIELHEVIVHGSKPSIGDKHDRDHLKASAVQHDSANEKKDALSNSHLPVTLVRPRPSKLSVHQPLYAQKVSSQKLSIMAAQSPVGTVDIDDYAETVAKFER